MHDGSHIQLRKLEEDYDPTEKMGALHRLMWAQEKQEFITGLIYYDGERESLAEASDLTLMPLAHLPAEKIRPSAESLEEIMASLM